MTTDATVLGQIALGYSPFIDRARTVTATRLTVFPLRPDAVPSAAQLLEAIAGVWPPTGGRVSLNIASERLLTDAMSLALPENLMLEIPSFMAVEPEHVYAIRELQAAGSTLLLKGRPRTELPREVAACFRYSIVEAAEGGGSSEPAAAAGKVAGNGAGNRAGNGAGNRAGARTMEPVQAGVRSPAEMEAAFARGAQAVLGWPIGDAVVETPTGRDAGKAVAPGMQVIVELIHRVDREEPIEKLEATLKRDPPLAFKLLRYINSPAFGLRVEVSSFRHAIMLLGYKRLKRWLALLLATASKDVNQKPVMFAAVRRGLLMEELARGSGDEEMRGELFICGVFSLLDRMFHQPFGPLLDTIPVPERVRQALADDAGPFRPYLEVVRAAEGESLFDLRDAAEQLMMGMGEINRALLRALLAATEVE